MKLRAVEIGIVVLLVLAVGAWMAPVVRGPLGAAIAPGSKTAEIEHPRSAPNPIEAGPRQPAEPAEGPTKPAARPAPDGMAWIPGGTFWMGADDASMPDARPIHEVTVSGFWMDRTEVTNRQFARFVSETAYLTIAERPPDPKDFPDAPPEKLVPGSIVFTPPAGRVSLENPLVWWRYVPGANWRHPEGPQTNIEGKDDYPVVQICWYDVVAYANWAGKRLPTEAEWELAARGGKVRSRYVWGDDLLPGGKWQANTWQGHFPDQNSSDDGFARTAPVATFPPNGFGLYDIAGNVWEWCGDWYRPGYQTTEAHNPTGPTSSYDPDEPGVDKRVQRGGSYLCSDQYCTRYLPGRGAKVPATARPRMWDFGACFRPAASLEKALN